MENKDIRKHFYEGWVNDLEDLKIALYSLNEVGIKKLNYKIVISASDDQWIKFLKALDKRYNIKRDEKEYAQYCKGIEEEF